LNELRDEFVLNIKLYSSSADLTSASIDSFTSSISQARESSFSLFGALGRKASRRSFQPNFSKLPTLGDFIGEFTIVIPSEHAFSKVTGSHAVLYGKKEVGKVMLQMGLFLDGAFAIRPVLTTNAANSSRVRETRRLSELAVNDQGRVGMDQELGRGYA
jgi:hypothetical protein